ncbi:hypothetical protein EYF80_037166 [Liparis tanakae]|uniref:Uncharacterized protein n=1 Tax=Liparis tanakae TaxID=230148 RepID=A0A4Z2GGB8_9TELE|nr:hypothetical protein EYF80_037166 [Liparis tanakae]
MRGSRHVRVRDTAAFRRGHGPTCLRWSHGFRTTDSSPGADDSTSQLQHHESKLGQPAAAGDRIFICDNKFPFLAPLAVSKNEERRLGGDGK